MRCLLFSLVILSACGGPDKDFPEVRFDSSYPARNIDLSNILGNEIVLKSYCDTLKLNIKHDKKFNLITNAITGDTVFYGTVSKFRGVYYFCRKVNENDYRIHAVKIIGNIVYGLRNEWQEELLIANYIKKGQSGNLVISMNQDTSLIVLHPVKRDLRKLFRCFIDSLAPDTILRSKYFAENLPDSSSATNTDTENLEENYDLIYKVYPNPTKGLLTLELQEKQWVDYFITPIGNELNRGATLLRGQLTERTNTIDINELKSGIYILTVGNPLSVYESVKIIKVD